MTLAEEINRRARVLSRKRFYERLFPGAPMPPMEGPGTELKKLLAAFGVKPANCHCMQWAAQMNREGVDWSRANLDAIASQMVAEARQRGWPLPERLMGAGARALVRLAIWRARKS